MGTINPNLTMYYELFEHMYVTMLDLFCKVGQDVFLPTCRYTFPAACLSASALWLCRIMSTISSESLRIGQMLGNEWVVENYANKQGKKNGI